MFYDKIYLGCYWIELLATGMKPESVAELSEQDAVSQS